MTKVAEIVDRAACATWCPLSSHPDVIAIGSKDSGLAGFADTGGELELYDLNLGGQEGRKCLGSVKTASRFASVAWTPFTCKTKFPMGLIAGGMVDGTVHLWNPAAMLQGGTTADSAALVYTVQQHEKGPVGALKFNALDPSRLATGGCNGQVLILDLNDSGNSEPLANVSEPCPGQRQGAEITALAWNSQVAHICASAAADGSIAVWDLQNKKAWCELRAETAGGQGVADLAWNPAQGLHLLTAAADDRNPVLKVWDLRASTSMPIATLQGHAAGILSMAWCPHDDSLLLTTAKDHRTLLWDLVSMQPIADIPNEIMSSTTGTTGGGAAGAATAIGGPGGISAAAAGFGGAVGGPASNDPSALFASSSLAEQKHLRYFVCWSPLKRGIALTCSLGRNVQAHSVLGLATKSGRPPKWMKPKCAVSMAFGGMLVSVGSKNKIATLSTVREEPALVRLSRRTEGALQQGSVLDFCSARSHQAAAGSWEALMWGFMQVIFETAARQQLLHLLGFDEETIAAAAAAYNEQQPDTAATTNGVASMSLSENSNKAAATSTTAMMSAGVQDMVKKSLLVGNFEAAVDVCFRTGNLADGLILASCGGAELWAKAQERYFACSAQDSSRRAYVSIVSGVVLNRLDDFVARSDCDRWQETLAILSTYGQSDEFPRLCVALGDKLARDAGDERHASLCYMCALDLDKTVRYWKGQLDAANAASSAQKNKKGGADDGGGGGVDWIALHEFVIRVSVFLQAVGSSAQLSAEMSLLFSQYAQVLAHQGCLVTAAKYCLGDAPETKMLRDRLYRSRSSQACLAAMGGSPPEFPYAMQDVQVSRGQVNKQEIIQQQQQQKAAAQALQQQQQQAAAAAAQAQQQQQQQAQQAAQQQQQQAAASNQLPAGWMALQDPSSGRTYYANQTTGEVTWDRPAAPQAPAAAYPTTPNVAASAAETPVKDDTSTHSKASYKSNGATSTSTPAKLASRYGDGFVSSASHPELAFQYGNVGTSNPYKGVARPGTAQQVVDYHQQGGSNNTPATPGAAGDTPAATPQQAPISGTFNVDALEVDASLVPVRDTLTGFVAALQGSQLSAADRRQLGEAERGAAILVKKLARPGLLEDECVAKVTNMVSALSNRDYHSALAIQTGLVNSDWKEHKDWLKGIKLLIQLASKKF